MHIAQQDIDIINGLYTCIDESAFKVLLYRYYQKYLYGTIEKTKVKNETLTNKRDYTDEAKADINFILQHNPEFSIEEVLTRLVCRFEDLFRNTFDNLLIT